ncbi:MAG TPA: xanthine dehydrogenase family protein subunit M [Vineibacter sp.]|nr:xanthine dehydrogenase family protein subunit M [Vineibacter sp.]
MTPVAYHRPADLAAVLALLAADEEARPLAGGQTLVPMLNLELLAPTAIVSLIDVAELRGIRRLDDGTVRIGAMETHARIAASDAFRDGQALIPDTARQIASPAIRNFGTIGGACAHGDPASDWPAALVGAGATIEIAGRDGIRNVAAEDFFLQFLTTALEPGELVTAIIVPPLPGRGRYYRFARVDSDYPILSIACVADIAGGLCRFVRLAAGACGPTPVRVATAEALLAGRPRDAARVRQAGTMLAEAAEPIDDVRGSADYRRRILPGLIARVLDEVAGP